MSAQRSVSASSTDAAVAAVAQNGNSRRDCNSDDADRDNGADNEFQHRSLPSLTAFPSLTGLRPQTRKRGIEIVNHETKVLCSDLENATVTAEATPVAALQIAWATILSAYTAAQDDVVFVTVGSHAAWHESKRRDAYCATITSVQAWAKAGAERGRKTISSFLRELAGQGSLTIKDSTVLGDHQNLKSKQGGHGSTIAWDPVDGPECEDSSTLGKKLLESEDVVVIIVASSSPSGRVRLQALYNDLFLNESSSTVMLEQLDDLLGFIVAHPTEPISHGLDAMRNPLLSLSNEHPKTDPISHSSYLQNQFEEYAQLEPDRIALDFRTNLGHESAEGNTLWTYGQLNENADTFAKHLVQQFGQLPDEIIPICMDRRPELYVAILGTLKAGAAWCPIDPSFPPRRRHDLIARTGSKVLVVADQDLSTKSEGIPSGVIPIDILRLRDDDLDDRLQKLDTQIGSLAYLIWTSGTTGEPKGVPISHTAAVSSMRSLQSTIPSNTSNDAPLRCLQFSSFTFDVSIQDLFYTWGLGGTIISSTRNLMLGSFADLATATKATHCHLTPAFAASVPRAKCPTLEVVTMIGEKLPQAVADDWSSGGMKAYNTYGPAEAAVVATLRQFGAPGDQIQSGNIGYPLSSVSCFVLDRNGRTLPRHGIGELALGGPQLSHGYWKDAERSQGRFVWNERLGLDLYMTGDIVRQLYDGSLEFVGREDDLIKIQGIRVELSEIGYSLRQCHDLVEQVEVQYLERRDRPSKVLVAFLATPKLSVSDAVGSELVWDDEAVKVAQGAKEEARDNLPDYMIPMVFLVVTSIPRTSSNKTDKTALQKIYDEVDLGTWESKISAETNEPSKSRHWTAREAEIVSILAELSRTSKESMSRKSDLRSIGIDSITATRLAPMLNAKGFHFSVADVLLCQTLEDLFGKLNTNGSSFQVLKWDLEAFHDRWCGEVSKTLASDIFVAPALSLQESMLTETMQDANAYWSHTFLKLASNVDETQLRKAWQQVVSCTEALRTGFLPVAMLSSEGQNDTSISESTFVQLTYNESVVDWTHIESTNSDLKIVARDQSHTVAEAHQKQHLKLPLLSITFFELPSQSVLMVSIHHAIRDELSLDLILQDVQDRYLNPNQNPQKRSQLRDALSVMLPTSDQIDQDRQFWKEALEDFSTTEDACIWPDLRGNDNQHPELTTGSLTRTQTFKKSYSEMQKAALAIGASSVASVLRVAWGCILLAYLETDTVVFAETWSSRVDDPGLADIVGPLLAVLPVPFRASGSARAILAQQSAFQREVRQHKSIHARDVRKLLGRAEGQGLYAAVFNFLPQSGSNTKHGGSHLWTKIDGVVPLSVEHPMALNVAQTANDMLEMEVTASRSIINFEHLAVIAGQVDAFVNRMLDNSDLSLSQISSLLPAPLLSKSSVTFSEEVKNASTLSPVHWVDYYSKTYPDWLAVQVASSIADDSSPSESWSFAQLKAAYERVAFFIGHCGHRNRMIAMCLDRRIEAYAVILGVIASGNCYLPIDEDLPAERKSFLLRDSSAATLFTTRTLAASFSAIADDIRTIYVDDGDYMIQTTNGCNGTNTESPLPTDNAYLLYTSGSTGVPKGVLVGRGNLSAFIEGLSEFIYPLVPGMKDLPGRGRYLGLASRAFDVHLAEMFLAWRRGLAAVTAPRTMLLDDLQLALKKLRITHASFVPSLIDQAGLDPANLPDLHYLGVGGEKMSKRVVDMWALNENTVLVNAYGPTELSIGCAASEVTPTSNLRNVGRPYGNSVAHVLKPGTDEYTLRGVAGELCYTGDLVVKGYHNRPDAKGFVEDFEGQRMYRTGDVVRLLADDTIEYLRREDDQTKVRGQRLELGEISEAIRSVAKTAFGLERVEVVTMVAKHPKLSRSQLISFMVPGFKSPGKVEAPAMISSEEGDAIAHRIRSEARKVLPGYMVPDVVISLTTLPLAPQSGKADMKRLKALYSERSISNSSEVAKSDGDARSRKLTESETKVQQTVAGVLMVEPVEVEHNTNIFRLGLDSLSAISLAIKLQKIGYDCTVSSVLANPSIEKLASLPQKQQQNGVVDKMLQTRTRIADLEERYRKAGAQRLDRGAVQAIKPCLPLQETLVASSLNANGASRYVNHVKLKLARDVDCARLRNAWEETVANNEILRTCFRDFMDGIVQIVLKYAEPSFVHWEEASCSDFSSALQSQQDVQARSIIENMAAKPPLRLSLFHSEDDSFESVLFISMHHALYDAVSLPLILNELSKRYARAIYQPHTSFDRMIEYVHSRDQEAANNFWTKYLKGVKPTSVLKDDRLINGQSKQSTLPTVDRTFASSRKSLEGFSASIGSTLTSTIQAVFGIVLVQMLSLNDVLFGVVLSGRTVPIENADRICAPCITTIPQRVTVQDTASTVRDVLRSAQQGFVDSLEYQHTALRHIHRWVGAEKPLFDCLVSYIQKKKAPDEQSELWTKAEDSMPNDFPLAIEFEADEEGNCLRAHCVFDVGFGDIDRASMLLENIDLLLGALVRGEDVNAQDLGIPLTKGLDQTSHNLTNGGIEWTPREHKIQEIVAKVSGMATQEIGREASFFSLGIDSITAIRFARQLRNFGMECSSADVMRYPSIATLAQHIAVAKPTTNGEDAIAHPKQEIDDERIMSWAPRLGAEDKVLEIYPCTSLQASMLTQSLGSDGYLYSNHHAFRLSHTVDLSLLKQAFCSLTASTEILRTTFHFSRDSSAWLAATHRLTNPAWEEQRTTDSMASSIAALIEATKFMEESDFQRPPWKTSILRAAKETVMVISMHHSLYDGESIYLLLSDLNTLYNGHETQLRPKFSDAARAISRNATDAESFWIKRLDGYQTVTSYSAASSTRTEPVELERILVMKTPLVLSACKILGTTPQTIAFLAFAKMLSCISGHRDIVFGHVVGGRSLALPSADDIIGPLFNTVPARVTLDKTYQTNRVAAAEIQRVSGESQPYQHAALGKIQQAWRRGVGDAEARLFDALFVFVNVGGRRGGGEGEGEGEQLLAPYEIGETVAPTEYANNFELEQRSKDVVIRMSSQSDNVQVEQWLAVFEQVFQDILEHPHRSVLAFPPKLQNLPLTIKSRVEKSVVSESYILSGEDLDTIRQVLSGVSGVPAQDFALGASIYSLGLDSIAAINVATKCRKRGLDVSVADVLQGQSLRGICERIRAKRPTMKEHDGGGSPMINVETRNKALAVAGVDENAIEDVLPCLAGQTYHLALWKKSTGKMGEAVFAYSAAYGADVRRMASAWNRLKERHPILRTLFAAVPEAENIQIILKGPELKNTFHVEDVSADRVEEMMRDIAHKPLGLEGPLAQLHLLRSESRTYLLLKLHHATYDAWTIKTLLRDLTALFRQQDLPSTPNYQSLVRKLTKLSKSASAHAYWRRSLQGCKATLLPASSSNASSGPPKSNFVWIKAALNDLRALEETCRQHSIALPNLFLLGFAKALAHHSVIESPCFGLYQAGRSISVEGLDRSCLPTLNVTPLIVRDVAEVPALESLRRIQENLAERVEFEQCYLRDVLQWLGEGERPLFNTYINILTHEEKRDSTFAAASKSEELLVPYTIPEDALAGPAPSVAGTGDTTNLDAMDTSYLAEHNLYLDFSRHTENDCVDLGIKCDELLPDEEGVRGFANDIKREVEEIVHILKN